MPVRPIIFIASSLNRCNNGRQAKFQATRDIEGCFWAVLLLRHMEVSIIFDSGFEQMADEAWLRGVAEAVLVAEGKYNAEIGIVITGQDQIQGLNKRYRAKDTPTDVLAFAMADVKDETPFPAQKDGIDHLGEVIISVEQAAIQAGRHRHSVGREIAVLLVHGVLHLIGYDHNEQEEEKTMNDRARAILKHLPRRVS